MTLAVNYSDVLATLQDHGLVVTDLRHDTTKSVRCRIADSKDKEKRGWYWLHEISIDGAYYLIGSYGIFQGADSGAQKIVPTKKCNGCHRWVGANRKVCPHCGSSDVKKEELSPEQKAAMKARMEENKRRQEAERQAEIDRAARRAQIVWQKCQPTWTNKDGVESDTCSYLQSKQVKAHGLRFTPTGAPVVPMMDGKGLVHGLQFIFPKDTHAAEIRKNGGSNKRFWPAGMGKQGRYHLVGAPTTNGVILVAEGYASGASPHEATGLPFATAFDAGNLLAVAADLRKRYKTAKILFLADDDAYGKCPSCKKLTSQPAPTCAHCGADTSMLKNAGVTAAELAALTVPNSAWVAPKFADPEARRVAAMERGEKLTDFNDLHVLEGLQPVRAQVEARLLELGWTAQAPAGAPKPKGGGDTEAPMPSRLTVEEAVARYCGTYGLGGKALFDYVEHRLIHKDDVLNLLPSHGWDAIKNHPRWRVHRDSEIGFDPTGKDPRIKCNHFSGWPTVPKQGNCGVLLDLLEYLCSNEENGREVFLWMLKWLAYPLQHPGAKMHSAIVVHGPQGTGKSRFFEAYSEIFGRYGRVLGQEALEDKFNSDWAEAKLFILADEVLARQDMYHIKNRLKGFITGGTIRVNPKNVAAHNERNHMNIVFLSNERMPLVLENDDRRHCVIYVPPKLSDGFFLEVDEEIANGGVAALHHYLLTLDLGDFKPWTKPPMTKSKEDLIELGRSSEERFLNEWMAGELDGPNGTPLPFCPCKGNRLYQAYSQFCEHSGERKRPVQHLISLLCKQHGWTAGKSERTVVDLSAVNAARYKNRKMVVPSDAAMAGAAVRGEVQAKLLQRHDETKAQWLTRCHFEFERAMGIAEVDFE